MSRYTIIAVVTGIFAGACTGSTGATGDDGEQGERGAPGTDGERGLSGPRGDEGPRGEPGERGQPGAPGEPGPVGDGGLSGPSGDAGVMGPQGDPGVPGAPGPAFGQTPGLSVKLTVSSPSNGTHFVAGERVALTLVLEDGRGYPLAVDALSQSRLMVSGPRSSAKTKTAVALLATTADRTSSQHHYVSLKDTTNDNLVVDGNVLRYTLEAVGGEEPGTYTAGFWAVVASYPMDQAFALADFQIGTATVEPDTVAGGCDSCHLGAANRQYYMHHVDPSASNPYGYPSIDSAPIASCRTCHNQDGYAAVRKCSDGSKPVRDGDGQYICADGSQDWSYMSDPIVRRVHGVHRGSGLLSEYATNADWGDFHDYVHVTFPSDVRNCAKCHNDDAWKTKPTRGACGACHDQVEWSTGAYVPPRPLGLPGAGACAADADCTAAFGKGVCNVGSGGCELTSHAGGPQADDGGCKTCHGADPDPTPPHALWSSIAENHAIPPPEHPWDIALTVTPVPANGTHYVAGEKPVVRMVITDKSTGMPIDHATVAAWNRVYLFVNGPRGKRIPALTSAARAEVVTAVAPFDLSTAADLKLRIGELALALDPGDGTFADLTTASESEVVGWLNADAGFAKVAFAETRGATVVIHARPSPTHLPIAVEASDGTTALGLVPGTYAELSASGSYAANDLKVDPKVTFTTGAVLYQLDDVASAAPGTYSVWVRVRAVSGEEYSFALATFQVRTGVAEKKVATNCADCHTGGFHGGYPFDPDVCGSCHDYRRAAPARVAGSLLDGWGASAASGRSNFGFGAAPLSRRVHGVHFGNYVNYPYDIHASWGEHFSHVIFPQDVRNCVKCHSQTDEWKHEPGRVACLGCHDSDAAEAHALQMTFDPTPVDPFSGDEQESCGVCHGDERDYSVEDMHDITAPYAPPYLREGWVTGPHVHPVSSE